MCEENEKIVELKDGADISVKVNRLCRIKQQIDDLKKEADEIEGYFLKLAEDDLVNTKLKTLKYSGSGLCKVSASYSTTTKVIFPAVLKEALGEAFKDVVKEETTYKLTEPGKRMLAGIYLKQYVQLPVQKVINEITDDFDVRAALMKKCRGVKFETDKKALMSIAGLSEEDAEHYAFFISEAACWEQFAKLVSLGKYKDNIELVLEKIDASVVATENPKVEVSYE